MMIAIFKVIFSFIFISRISANPFFVSPVPTPCSATSTCNGDILTPFDNLFDALTAATPLPLAYIVLLYSSSADHYVMKPSSTADPETNVQYAVNNLILKPLYCVEEPVLSNPALLTSCIYPGQNITVNLKTVGFTLLIQANVVVQGIVFDAAEDIWPLNTNTAQLQDCVFNRKKCCQAGQTPSTLYPSTVSCAIQGTYSSSLRGTTNSLFVFSQTAGSSASPASLLLQGVGFQNFLSPHLRSLIRTTKNYFNLTLSYVAFDRVYFDKGIISHGDASSPMGSSVTANMSKFTMSDVSFTNYNPWDLVLKDQTRTEGYLFNAEDTFSGVFQMTRATFTSTTSSLRDSCWAQTAANYQAPMSNLLNTNKRSRSDLWGQVYAEKSSLNNYISSLIYIKALSGSISISTSSFKNIIGTSGSVIRVDDILANNNWITIYFAMFDGNFAYDKFANIMITKTSNPQFYSMLSAPRIEVVNASFTTSRGCPGAYGNVLLLNSWDSTAPKGSLTSYSLSTQIFSLLTAWTSTSDTTSYIRVKNTYFVNNMLSVSNSLAIVCSHFTILENNVFQGNGGTTAELAAASLATSYFGQRYPLRLAALPTSSFTHFGQSTAVYFDHMMKLFSRNNIYSGNWGPWEGSLALSTAITIKNWLKTSYALQFSTDYFGDHQGIPSTLASLLSDSSLKNSLYTDPLITISVDYPGLTAIISQLPALYSAISSATVLMNKVGIVNNIASYNYNSYTYNSNELKYFKDTLFYSRTYRYQNGLVKILWASEALDDISAGFINEATSPNQTYVSFVTGLISKNQLQSPGCLFTSMSILAYAEISYNNIYLDGETFAQPATGGYPFLNTIPATNNGLFCLQLTDSNDLGYALQLTASNLVVKYNQGFLLNLLGSNNGRSTLRMTAYITDSIFFNNTCIAASMIALRTNVDLISVNNIFAKNYNSAGNILLYNSANISSTFCGYFANDGVFASISFSSNNKNSALQPTEVLIQGYWNNISPQYQFTNLELVPSGGIYYLSSGKINIFTSDFRQNIAFSGIITADASDVVMHTCQVRDHNIQGNAVVGTFMTLTNFYLDNSIIKNNRIGPASYPYSNRPSLLVFFTALFFSQNVQIDGGEGEDESYVLFSNGMQAIITNMSVTNFWNMRVNGKTPLFEITYSFVYIVGFQASNVTGPFRLIASRMLMNYAEFSNVVNGVPISTKQNNQFLFDMFKTTLYLENAKYTGNGQYKNSLHLFTGDQNYYALANLLFINANGGSNSIFQVTTCQTFRIMRSVFMYTDPGLSNVTVFNLGYSSDIRIVGCIFSFAGRVLVTSIVPQQILFFDNTVISYSHLQNIYIEKSASNIIDHNVFISQDYSTPIPVSASQVQIVDSIHSIDLVQNNIFFSMTGENGIVEINLKKNYFSANLSSNIFIHNTGSRGGAIYASSLFDEESLGSAFEYSIKIENSAFLLNRAINSGATMGQGGVFYQTSPLKKPQKTEIHNSFFISNTAQDLGGAIYFDYSLPSVSSDSLFKLNFVNTKLNHIGSYPVRMDAIDSKNRYDTNVYIPGTPVPTYSDGEKSFYWKDIGSGVTTYKTFKFALVDMLNQVVFDDSSSTLEMYPDGYSTSNRSQFSLDFSTPAQNGIYILQNFKLNYIIDKSLKITFTSKAIPTTSPFTTYQSFQVQATFRKCSLGEYTIYINGNAACQECPSGFWYVNPYKSASTCDTCNLDTTICLGGNNAGPRQGYWRMNTTADLVLACPRPASCIGNNDPDPNQEKIVINALSTCAPNYSGNLCSSCVSGWAKGSNGDCVDCKTNVLSYLLLFFMMLSQAVIIGLGVKETLKSGENYSNTQENAESNSATLLRVFINYSQVFSLLVGIPIAWPNSGASGGAINISSRISAISNQLFTLDCFFLLVKNAVEIAIVFLKTLLTIFNPILFMICALIFWVVYFKKTKRNILNNKDFVNKMLTTITIICFDMQPAIVQSGLYLFQCQNLYRTDTAMPFLSLDFEIQCWKGEHVRWTLGLVIPALFVWVFLLPGIMLRYLKKNQSKLETSEIAKKFSFLYNGYKNEKFYWEFVIMLRKLFMIAATVFAGFNSPSMQIYMFLALILISYGFHAYHQPYTGSLLNQLEKISLVSLTTVCLCGLYFQIITGAGKFDSFIIFIGFLGYLYFMIPFCQLYFTLYIRKLKKNEKFRTKIEWLEAKLCCCLKNPTFKRNLLRMATRIYPVTSADPSALVKKVSDDVMSQVSEEVEPEKTTPNQESPERKPFEDLSSLSISQNRRLISGHDESILIPNSARDISVVQDEIESTPRTERAAENNCSNPNTEFSPSFTGLDPICLLEAVPEVEAEADDIPSNPKIEAETEVGVGVGTGGGIEERVPAEIDLGTPILIEKEANDPSPELVSALKWEDSPDSFKNKLVQESPRMVNLQSLEQDDLNPHQFKNYSPSPPHQTVSSQNDYGEDNGPRMVNVQSLDNPFVIHLNNKS